MKMKKLVRPRLSSSKYTTVIILLVKRKRKQSSAAQSKRIKTTVRSKETVKKTEKKGRRMIRSKNEKAIKKGIAHHFQHCLLYAYMHM